MAELLIENMDTKMPFKLKIAANEIFMAELLIENMDTKMPFKLKIAANGLEFEELSQKLENYLIESYPNIIFEFEGFTKRSESALVSILKRDNIKMKEWEIWDYLIN
ncbi:hypothetical protein Glove_275g91 [Diversispora epigaea]|uniref:Uncharacterized protein n=1 Tax=Diversispora epigaea TaxID=1348612 RepID=A0A397I9N2_9GLOM|nr:hypothetical protein Glove_275g91 [Diversispora epigaea]